MAWTYDAAKNKYRSTETGRYLSATQAAALRDRFVEAKRADGAKLAERLVGKEIDLPAWIKATREDLKKTHGALYMLGRGGKAQMTKSDWGSLGAVLKGQYKYLNAFAGEIGAGESSPEYISNRLGMYYDSSRQSYERGNAKARDQVLPAYPGDGSTKCRTNCGCTWEYRDDGPYWIRHKDDSCPTCIERAREWAPWRG